MGREVTAGKPKLLLAAGRINPDKASNLSPKRFKRYTLNAKISSFQPRITFPQNVAVMSNYENVVETIVPDQLSHRRQGPRRLAEEVAALQQMSRCFAVDSASMLQCLVEIAMDLCRAHSAGISLEHREADGAATFRWVATAGKIVGYRGRSIPRDQSPCGVVIDRNMPLLFHRPGVAYPKLEDSECPIIEGLLVPLQVDAEVVGTLWVLSHTEFRKFDREDLRLLESLANMAIVAVRSRRTEEALRRTTAALAVAQVANRLAHEINNPLQALQNSLFLAAHDHPSEEVLSACLQADRVCDLVKYILRHDATDADLKLLQTKCKKSAVSVVPYWGAPVYCKCD